MIICCIGDSLTEGDYGVKGMRGIANVHSENYPYFLAQLSGAEVRNFGKCGWRSSDMLRWYEEGGLNLEGADTIILMLGTNGGQTPAGTSQEDMAYKKLVMHLRQDQPQAKLFVCTPPNVTENPAYSNCGYAPHVLEAVLFVRKFAEEEKLNVIDLAASKRISRETEDELQSNDGLHFNREGYVVLAEEIWAGIQGK